MGDNGKDVSDLINRLDSNVQSERLKPRAEVPTSEDRYFEKPLKFTPLQTRVMRLLGDGETHTYDEILEAMGNLLNERTTFHNHMKAIRNKLTEGGTGMTVVCLSIGRRRTYRLMRKVKFDG